MGGGRYKEWRNIEEISIEMVDSRGGLGVDFTWRCIDSTALGAVASLILFGGFSSMT